MNVIYRTVYIIERKTVIGISTAFIFITITAIGLIIDTNISLKNDSHGDFILNNVSQCLSNLRNVYRDFHKLAAIAAPSKQDHDNACSYFKQFPITEEVRITTCIYEGELRIDIRRFQSNIPQMEGIHLDHYEWQSFFKRLSYFDAKFRHLFSDSVQDGCVHTLDIGRDKRIQLCMTKGNVYTRIYHHIDKVNSGKGIELDSLETMAFIKFAPVIEETVVKISD